jgi:hypothetical protein
VALLGTGILAIWNDILAAAEDDYHDWYLRDHFPDRLSVPGFRRGRRYVALAGAPKYFTFYETAAPEVLASAAYLARLEDPTPWTGRVMPSFRAMSRTPCRVEASLGAGEGGVVLTIRLAAPAGERARLLAALAAELLPAALECRRVVAAHLWAALPRTAGPPTREVRLRGGPDAAIDLAAVVEATDAEALAAVAEGPLASASLAARGAAPGAELGVYRLLNVLAAGAGAEPLRSQGCGTRG